MICHSEIWREIPSLPEYLASSFGRVKRKLVTGTTPTGGLRTYGGIAIVGQWDSQRYIFVFRHKTYKVHRLVCEAFNGPPPFPNAVCMHLDENARNNWPHNLKWGTQRENLAAPGFRAYCRSRLGNNSPYRKGKAKRHET